MNTTGVRLCTLVMAAIPITLALSARTLSAQCDIDQLLASDGGVEDFFGAAVAIDGDVAVIGAAMADAGAENAGAAYVYRFSPGIGAWVQEAKLVSTDPTINGNFGVAVDVSDDVLIVGTVVERVAYIFRHAGGAWNLDARVGNSLESFGAAVAIDGDLAIVSDPGYDAGGVQNAGTVWLYRFDGAQWWTEAQLLTSDRAPGDIFGRSIAVVGDVIVGGAPYDDDNGTESGSAYVFRFDGAAWNEEAKLVASDGAPGDEYGTSVDLSGDTAIIGAFLADEGASNNGAAYTYRVSGKTWTPEAKLLPFENENAHFFGRSVALDGDRAVIGAERADEPSNDTGVAYTFVRTDGAWNSGGKLRNVAGASGDELGVAVAVGGARALAGAHEDDDNGFNAGSAFVFDLEGADCTENGVPDVCDIMYGFEDDCDGNEIPDRCEVLFFQAESPNMSPLGDGFPHAYIVPAPPESWMDVTVTVTANGDLAALAEYVDVFLNGDHIGAVFQQGARDCPATPDEDEIVLTGTMFNTLVAGGDATFDLIATAAVDPALCGQSFIRLAVEYQAVTDNDCNGNGVPDLCDIVLGTSDDENGNGIPDECETPCPADLDGSGAVDFGDILAILSAWGQAGGPEDLDASGTVDFGDLLVVLGSWGACPS